MALSSITWIISQEKINIEHVTYYIYTHPDEFHIKFLEVPKELKRNDIRLTIDTKMDLEICQNIVSYLEENQIKWDFNQILKYIDENPILKEKMRQNIKEISKI